MHKICLYNEFRRKELKKIEESSNIKMTIMKGIFETKQFFIGTTF